MSFDLFTWVVMKSVSEQYSRQPDFDIKILCQYSRQPDFDIKILCNFT
jgi:hypothetical protein